jgi:hypothetical protein
VRAEPGLRLTDTLTAINMQMANASVGASSLFISHPKCFDEGSSLEIRADQKESQRKIKRQAVEII